MGFYRKKPVVIEAVRWLVHGDHPAVRRTHYAEMSELMGGTSGCTRYHSHWDWAVCGVMETPEGKYVVAPGDWIIKGVKGELYPCKADIFAATYEPVSEQQRMEDGMAEAFRGGRQSG